jgi:hypothetical protein
VSGIRQLLHDIHEQLLLLLISLNEARFLRLALCRNWRCCNPLRSFLRGWGTRSVTSLTLLALGRPWWLRRSRVVALWLSDIIVHTLHVVTKVPVAWEAITSDAALTTLIGAKEGLITMSMHSVGFTLMSQKAGRGWELKFFAGGYLTFVWLEVGVHEFAVWDPG